jgi:hypothetical protein
VFPIDAVQGALAGIDTAATEDASVAEEHQLGLRLPGLGTVAPSAGEGTSLEIDRHPDPGTVVHSEGIHVEDQTGFVVELDLSRHERPS